MMQTKQDDNVDVDDAKCYFGHMAAESILNEIDEYKRQCPGSAKAEVLPCQSDIESRSKMAASEKELCRQKKRKEDTTIHTHAHTQMKNKWELQLKQIQNNISDSFKYFLYCLFVFDRNNRKYFLQSLKLGLDKRSIQLLQPLYDEYEKCRAEDESSERDATLKKLDDKLTHGSLEIEHFFREMAVMYENIVAMKKHADCNDLDEIMDLLAEIMADVLMEGTAMEIIDGDVVNVPVPWLSAVLNKVDKRKTSTLFKISVLGAQSCGKSTLLNTVFGLNFPVSSGRCTRGAYMQLVKVDKKLKKSLKCDFIAVIDSEGLMSRTKPDNSDYDNELSTFIIGLSDLTLVIIKGEGNEMHDVLPLAIHVFLRMNLVGEHQACHFVHQNMGAVDVMTKVATEIDAFVRELNVKTLTAAKDVGKSEQYTRFTDILKYNPTTDNTYVPGLWDGALPMAKTNAHYSKTMQLLKRDICKNVVNNNKEKRMFTFADFTKRLNELWEAIKYENFILSFKNVLAVEAHKKLTRLFTEERWPVRREIENMMEEEENIIENEIAVNRRHRTVRQLVDRSRLKLTNHLKKNISGIKERIMHYFQCPGCKSCSAEVTNRHLLTNSEREFREEIRYLELTMIREIEARFESLERRMTTDDHIQRLSREMNNILKKKVQEALRGMIPVHLTSASIEEIFDNLWTNVTRDILSATTNHVDRDPNIEATVQATITSFLGDESFHYHRKLTGRNRREHMESKFTVDAAQHLKLKRRFFFNRVSDEDVHRLQSQTDTIIEETSKHYTSNLPKGREFIQGDVEALFREVLAQLRNISDERFTITPDYTIDCICYIERRAVAGFSKLHKQYFKESSPETLLEKKKKGYHDLFLIEIGHGDRAVNFCETVLRDIILMNTDEQLSCTELLHDLRVHCGEMFRDIKSIQATIMIELYRKDFFHGYMKYITGYERFVKQKLFDESQKYFEKKDRLKALALTKTDKLISVIQKAIADTASGYSPGDNFMETFFSKIDNLKISHNDIAAYLELPVPDIEQFAAIIHAQLENAVKQDITHTIKYWDVTRKLNMKNMSEFLFKEVVGCSMRCPFCKVPCDAHSGGKTQGNHSAIMHRPKGVCGFSWRKTEKLVTEDCCESVFSSNRVFNFNEGWHPYKDYHKIYPTWTIHGNANPDVEKYWKWFYATYNKDLARYFNRIEADDIPEEWAEYTLTDIKQDIEDNYHIPVKESLLKRKY